MFHFLLTYFHFLLIFFTNAFPFHHQNPIAPTPTTTVSVIPKETPTPAISEVPTPTISSVPAATPTQIITPAPTMTPVPTVTPTPTIELTPTVIPTHTPVPTTQPTEPPVPIATPTPTFEPTIVPTAILAPTNAPAPTASPSAMLTDTPTPIPTTVPTPTPSVTKVGIDISFPQCGQTLPAGQGFGIVGVNGGIASKTNPCLGTELLWAEQSLGTLNQVKVQLYVNTGNPGTAGMWPSNNVDPQGNTSSNPFGTCDGSISTACAWQYGWNRAVDDVQTRFVPAAQSANIDTVPSDYPWWLDVETTNSWESGSDAGLERNRIDLEAMVSYFQSKGITVGIYSTNFQWGTIVGPVPSNSNLNGLRNWRAGATDLSGAQVNCLVNPLTSGGSVVITQFTTNNFDFDYSCL